MTDDAKKEAWKRRCSQLEALGVDLYTPQVPPDDSRFPQVQAILAEYKAVIGQVVPVPPGWEGSPPLQAITTLSELAGWLNDQWTSVLATEMGGEAYKTDALEQVARAVRNGFRVLAWLRVDERPERPPPAETLADAKLQFDALESWVRQKVKDGWIPPEPSQPEEARASPSTTGMHRMHAEIPDEYEVNLLINKYLSLHRRAPIREVAAAVDLSVGKVQQTEAWQQEMARRKAAKPPKLKERQPTKKMLASFRNEQSMDDVDDRIDSREATWRGIMEKATPIERAKLNSLSKNDREALIDTAEEQNADPEEQEKRWRWRRREGS